MVSGGLHHTLCTPFRDTARNFVTRIPGGGYPTRSDPDRPVPNLSPTGIWVASRSPQQGVIPQIHAYTVPLGLAEPGYPGQYPVPVHILRLPHNRVGYPVHILSPPKTGSGTRVGVLGPGRIPSTCRALLLGALVGSSLGLLVRCHLSLSLS